jgi:phosphatidylinositol alpha-mannosyltransferase
MNGAVSNLALNPTAVGALSRELRHGGYDVVHVHEPNAPAISWFATENAPAPLVGTFHTYSTSRLANGVAANVVGARRMYSKLHARIAVSDAARWTAERFYGGSYRVIPNGVDLRSARPAHAHDGDELRLLFVGRAEGRKGLPVLLRAFEALRAAGVPARLTVAGATDAEVQPLLFDPEGVEVAGRVSDEDKWRLLGEADLLVAPSLGGESFGMVLTEAFASATPVVCSDIAGYRDVVRDGRDGILVPVGQPVALGEALRALALDPERRSRMSDAALEGAQRFAWPRVASEVVEAYEAAAAAPAPAGRRERAGARVGSRPAVPGTRRPPRRLPSIEPREPGDGRRRALRAARRVAVAGGAVAGVGLTLLALRRLGIDSVVHSLVAATEIWVLVAFALMCTSMLLRAEAWHAILRAALPGTRVRRRDAARGTMIGVLMSATLPARLGEPSRAFIVARRLGRVRDRFPVVLGTLVSQTLLNFLALAVLGSVMFATVGLFRGGVDALAIATVAPVVVLALVLAAPALLRSGKPSRFQRVQQAATIARRALVEVRRGLRVFRRPKLGAWAAVMQLSAWALQWMACYLLLVALGLDERAGLGAAAAVLFAVNLTAALPVTPSNVGVFQAACIAVLSAYGVGKTDAFAYGIVLQAVEILTAVALGMPALLREGMTWRDLRQRALHATPVELASAPMRVR